MIDLPPGAYVICQQICEHGLTLIDQDAEGCTWQHGENPEARRTFDWWSVLKNETWTSIDAWLREMGCA